MYWNIAPSAWRLVSQRFLQISSALIDLKNVVRHQSFWFQKLRNLSEYLAHLVGFIMRRFCGVASAGCQSQSKKGPDRGVKLGH